MKIILLIAEVIFTVYTIRRAFSKDNDGKYRFIGFGTLKLIWAMASICIVNLLTVIGLFSGVGYIFDMVFLGLVVIELLFW